jgi:hypothetical protein
MKWYLTIISIVFLVSCGYSPEQMILDVDDSTSDVGELTGLSGNLYAINSGKQVCNSSISQDTVNYPGALLWLGFAGNLSVNNPPDDYTVTDVEQHDRLSISNTANEIDWFMMIDEVDWLNCEFQDPEWSAHPDYLVSLGGFFEKTSCDVDLAYDALVIRIKDKQTIRWKKTLDAVSTPHLWVDPTVRADTSLHLPDSTTYDENGLADVASIEAFFGTKNVKFSYSLKEEAGMALFIVDYSKVNPAPVKLTKPEGKDKYRIESALFSPDGNWVAYNTYENPFQYAAYIQSTAGAVPLLVSATASDPHWFQHPQNENELYVTYVEIPDGKGYKVIEQLDDATLLETGTAGSTWKRQVFLTLPEDRSNAENAFGVPKKIVNLPFKGGRSPDGAFMATGTNNAYLVELN